MERQEVRWDHYPLVAKHGAARTFVERLVLKQKDGGTNVLDACGKRQNHDFFDEHS